MPNGGSALSQLVGPPAVAFLGVPMRQQHLVLELGTAGIQALTAGNGLTVQAGYLGSRPDEAERTGVGCRRPPAPATLARFLLVAIPHESTPLLPDGTGGRCVRRHHHRRATAPRRFRSLRSPAASRACSRRSFCAA